MKSDFVIFGSSPLYLLDVLEFTNDTKINDLDIAVRKQSQIPKEAKVVYFHNDPEQKLHKLSISGINIDIGSAWPGQEKYFKKIFKNPTIVNNFKFANLDICQEWKELMVEKYNRDKDKYYLEKIKSFRLKHS